MQTQICELNDRGDIQLQRRIPTTRERLRQQFLSYQACSFLLESSTESEWVARCLEEMGHKVIVADPNYLSMYGSRHRHIKTDQRDAHALAQALRNQVYREAYRVSDRSWKLRIQLACRERLIRQRTQGINWVRATLRRSGIPVGSGSGERFMSRLGKVDVPESTLKLIKPAMSVMQTLQEQVRECDLELKSTTARDATIKLLMTVPGVGIITATAFLAVVDRVDRFRRAHELASYLGLVPSERSSGEKQSRGGITARGHGQLRSLLIEAAWSMLIHQPEEAEELWSWVIPIAQRRGKQIAVVALARRLAGVLFAIARDQKPFSPCHRHGYQLAA
jgi:transposase